MPLTKSISAVSSSLICTIKINMQKLAPSILCAPEVWYWFFEGYCCAQWSASRSHYEMKDLCLFFSEANLKWIRKKKTSCTEKSV